MGRAENRRECDISYHVAHLPGACDEDIPVSSDTWHADLSPVAPTHMRVVPDGETLQPLSVHGGTIALDD